MTKYQVPKIFLFLAKIDTSKGFFFFFLNICMIFFLIYKICNLLNYD